MKVDITHIEVEEFEHVLGFTYNELEDGDCSISYMKNEENNLPIKYPCVMLITCDYNVLSNVEYVYLFDFYKKLSYDEIKINMMVCDENGDVFKIYGNEDIHNVLGEQENGGKAIFCLDEKCTLYTKLYKIM
jgi:hypothetical protein